VQSRLEVPELGPSVVDPVIESALVVSSGMRPGGTAVACPPPKYRQPSPSCVIAAVHAVLESSSPESGGAGGDVSPAGPQLVVPGTVVKTS
jgi:hypothetical protein